MDKQYFSQWGQDKWVAECIFNFEKGRYFIDLAASEGIFFSNTYFLEKYLNWKGICIEANDKTFVKLRQNRTCICEHVCVDNKKQKVKFTSNDDKQSLGNSKEYYLTGGIIDDDVRNKNKENRSFVWKQTVTLKDILEKYNAPFVIDFFSLDIQGAETRVMKDFPFDKYIFLSMCVERPGKLLRSIFKKNGYIEAGSNTYDKFYIHKRLFQTFSIKKKCIIYYHYILGVFNIRKIRNVRRLLYYSRHIREIPSMIKRKFF